MTSYAIPGTQRWLSESDWKPSATITTLDEADTLSSRFLLSWSTRHSDRMIFIIEDVESWLGPFLEDANRLLALPEGWDSYNSESVSSNAVARGLNLLVSIMSAEARSPDVVPTSNGGVQLEWHDGERELEIEIPHEGKGWISWQESEQADHWETSFSPELPSTDVLERLRKAIAEFVTV